MIAVIQPGPLRGRIILPPSKSWAQRHLLCAACAEGTTRLIRTGDSQDVLSAVSALRQIGVVVDPVSDGLAVHGTGGCFTAGSKVSCGESATLLRMLLPLLTLQNGTIECNGTGSLPGRPILPLIEALRQNGARISGESLPLTLNGGLRGGVFRLPGGISSQFFSGLLLALPLLPQSSVITASGQIISLPYIRMTESVLRTYGIRFTEDENNSWQIPGGQRYGVPGQVTIPRDASAAVFFHAANALGSRIEMPDAADPLQPDSMMPALLEQLGSRISCADCPDLVPMLALAAAAQTGKSTVITGIRHLCFKESDRIQAVLDTVRAFGGEAAADDDTLYIFGRPLRGARIDGRGDHRIVMSAAILATVCPGETVITDAEAVGKSYPGFFRDLLHAGGKVSFHD